MYGSHIPTSVTAGLPGAIVPMAIARDGHPFMWIVWTVLLVATLVAVGTTLWRMVPRRGV